MRLLTDKIVLLLCCMTGLLFTGPDTACAAAFLSAVTVSAMCSVCQSTAAVLLLLDAYCAALPFVPEFFLFLPLIAYDFLPAPAEAAGLASSSVQTKKRLLLCFLRALPLVFAAAGLNTQLYAPAASPLGHSGENSTIISVLPLFLAALCALAVLLRFRTNRCETLHRQLLRTRDDDTEVKLLLEERNQSLLEKQDAEIYTATLRERNRIAREIHDNVGHMLTRSILMVGALRTIHPEPELSGALCQLEDTLNQAMNSIRESVHDLHDSSVNLSDTLAALARDFSFCPATLEYDMSPEVPREICFSFIAIVKEALVNTSRHSSATRMYISAVEHPGFYQLTLRDNGTPTGLFDENAFFDAPSGIGLQNIRSRVRALNGTIHFHTASGFCIYISIPKQP